MYLWKFLSMYSLLYWWLLVSAHRVTVAQMEGRDTSNILVGGSRMQGRETPYLEIGCFESDTCKSLLFKAFFLLFLGQQVDGTSCRKDFRPKFKLQVEIQAEETSGRN